MAIRDTQPMKITEPSLCYWASRRKAMAPRNSSLLTLAIWYNYPLSTYSLQVPERKLSSKIYLLSQGQVDRWDI